jgi:phosphotransferase system enzyme I (PtsI)
MPPPVELRGRPAAPGLAYGPIVRLAAAAASARTAGSPAAERAALEAAIAAAGEELADLAARVEGDAADILEFQVAMLEDEALSEPAYTAIAAHVAADAAWRGALDGQIAAYEEEGDEYFRARAADLADLRDRVARHLAGDAGEEAVPPGAIVAAEELTPSRFLAIDWGQGGAVALAAGSSTSHVAMLARARGVPMVVGIGAAILGDAASAFVDGEAGVVILDPDSADEAAFERRRAEEAVRRAGEAAYLGRRAETANGVAVSVMINVADPDGLASVDPATCDGIGLVRTEFLFHGAALPDEEAQYRVYRRIVEWAGGRPVTIRTLDAGGDKPIPGLTIDGESNPFLGVRGIRLSLRHEAVFRVQLRALARAAAHGTLKIMIPMVTAPDELVETRRLLDEEVASLAAAGIAARRPPLGMMVEVPAAALAVDRFPAEFLSIGSNDLTQYVCAASRDGGAVAALADTLHPAMLRLFAELASFGRAGGVEVSLCGDAGGDPAIVPHLLRAGLRTLSVAPTALARTKATIAATSLAA